MTSPLPWKVGEGSDDQKIILSANEKYICSIQIWQTPRRMGYDMEKERLVNASFIVKACNNHERLVEACKKAIIQLEYLDSRFPTSTTPAEINWIKQALQSAEE